MIVFMIGGLLISFSLKRINSDMVSVPRPLPKNKREGKTYEEKFQWKGNC